MGLNMSQNLNLQSSSASDVFLKANELRTQLLVRTANVGLWDWDLLTNQVYFSPEWKMQLGYAENELNNGYEEWESRLHPEDRDAALTAVREFRAGIRPVYDVEFRLRHKDGSWRWICARADFQPDATGKSIRIMGCHLDITDRKKADAARMEALERLEKIASRVPGIVYQFRMRPDGKLSFPYASEGMRLLLGVGPEEVREDATKVFVHHHPEDEPDLIASIEKSKNELSPWSHEFRFRLPDGTVRWISGSSIPEREPDGSTLWHGYMADVSERKQTEEALRRSQEDLSQAEGRWQFALEGGRDGVWDWNIVDRTVFYSKRWLEILGFADGEVGTSADEWKALIHPDDIGQVMNDVRAHLEGTTPYYNNEHRIKCKDGSWKWILDRGLVISRDTSGRPLRMVGTHSDITERKQAEALIRDNQALENSAASMRLVATSARVGLVVVNKEHIYTFANAAYSAILNLPNDLVGKRLADVLLEIYEVRVRPRLERAFAGERMDYEIRIPSATNPIHCAVNYEPVMEGNVVTSVAIVVMDITAQRNTEEQLRQSQKMEAIGQLAGGIAHDFNNLLTIISGYTNLLLKKLTPPDPAWNFLSEIGIASKRAAELTSSLLAFSHQQIRTPESVNLNEVVVETLKLLERALGEGIEISVALEPQLKQVWMDRSEVSQILLNLSINARDAMEEEGTLIIQTQNVTLQNNNFGAGPNLQSGEYVLLTVTDSGGGMTEDVQRRIFEPFFTTKPVGKGTGLGLAMVHGIVSRSGGSIEVASTAGKGTVFRIYLPQSNSTLSLLKDASNLNDSGTRLSGGTETVLLAEDDQTVRGLTRTILNHFGYNVIEATNGQSALQTFVENRHLIQLVITDVVMPGMNGAVLAEHIHELEPTIPVLMISGYAGETVSHKKLLDSRLNFLQKPFDPNTFAMIVRELLNRRSSAL